MKWLFCCLWIVHGILPGFSQNTPENIPPNCAHRFDSLSGRNIYLRVDEPPEYAGGEELMWAEIRRHLKWPGRDCCIQMTVFLSLVVETDGTISSLKIERGMGEGFCSPDDEAIAAVAQLKTWKPGKCGGKVVPVRKIIPIKFAL